MLSDYGDGVHLQSVASIIFLYFACITPIITFGGLLGAATDNYMVRRLQLITSIPCIPFDPQNHTIHYSKVTDLTPPSVPTLELRGSTKPYMCQKQLYKRYYFHLLGNNGNYHVRSFMWNNIRIVRWTTVNYCGSHGTTFGFRNFTLFILQVRTCWQYIVSCRQGTPNVLFPCTTRTESNQYPSCSATIVL